MYRVLVIILIFFPVTADVFDINGTWTQDKNRTTEFNNQHTVQSKLFKILYQCSNETLSFSHGKAESKSEDYYCSYNGKRIFLKDTILNGNTKSLVAV